MVDNSIKSYTLKLLIKLSKVKNFKFDELFLDNKKIDSLNLLNIYSLLEKKYNIKFKSSELGKLNSIDNIYKIINKKIK
jgi:acyl carrier protein